MSGLDIDLRKKLLNLYNQKKYTELEFEIELLGDLETQPLPIIMTYAASKALDLSSKKKDFVKAAYLFEKIYNQDKNNLEALYNLIIVSLKSKEFTYALNHLIERVKINKEDTKVLEGLFKIYSILGNISQALNYAEQLIKINPGDLNVWEGILSSFHYTSDKSQEEYFKQALEFDQLPKINCEPFIKINNKKSKIKLAFLSPDFKMHSVGFFLKGVLEKISKKDFEIIAFSNLDTKYHDPMTGDLKKIFNKWHDIKNISDLEFVNLARSLDVDILIDLSGFTLGNRIQALRVRCAPIQISWLGYCNTLGLECVDYLIADPNLIKKEEEKFYSEKILYLPKIWSAMSKPKDFPDVNILPVKNSSIFTFGSFNNFSKLSDETIKVWSKILNNSNSRLVLKSGSLTSDSTIENIRNKFFKFILEKNKILILNKDINRKDHIEQYNQIDVALDPFPYPGVTTSFESVMMGVPVLTMRGFNFNSRCGESINLNLEMQEFIATNSEDYYLKAIQLQKDPTKLELLRSSLRDKALASPLFDVDNFSENFCNTLKKVWNNHIDG